jgi:DNA-binding IclR family transcriptional regulator
MSGPDGTRIKALDNALDVLDAMTELHGAGVTELAEHVDLSKSAVYKHLATLEARGYVVREDGEYDLGLPWLAYGGYARNRTLPFGRIQTAVRELANETGELVLFSTLVEDASMPLYHARGENAVTTDSYAGATLPVHCTATGKAILAAMGDEARRVLDAVELRPYTANTLTDRAALEESLDRIRSQGFSLEDEERIDGMRGVGAAITNERTGEVLGALALTGPSHRVQGERFRDSFPRLMANRAREIEINVTYESG